MEVITLSQEEIAKYQVIKDSLDRKISNNQAATLLGLSTRQIIRLKSRVRGADLRGIVHGNRGKPPNTTIGKETKATMLNLYLNTYNGFNVSHFGEFLKEAHGIDVSRETLRNLLLNSGLRCKAKSQPKHRSRRTRMPKSGLLIQMDSSEHQWLGGDSIWLIATIDDATGEVPYALFVDSDSTENNMRVIKRLIENKGRVERLFGTFQDRLLKELKLYKISSIEKANVYLHNKFLPRFNNKFSNTPKDKEGAWRVLPKELNLESVFSIKEQRTVMADNTISFRNRIFQIRPDKYRISFAKAKVVVEKRLDGSIKIKYKDRYLDFKEITSYETKRNKTNTLPIENLLTGDIFPLHQG